MFNINSVVLVNCLQTLSPLSSLRQLCFRVMQVLKTKVSQGSVATLFSCGEVCNNPFIAKFLLSVPINFFYKLMNIW